MLSTNIADGLLTDWNEETYILGFTLLNSSFSFISPITGKEVTLNHKEGVIGLGTFFYSPSVILDPRFDINSQEQDILLKAQLDKINYSFYFININSVVNYLFNCPIELLQLLQQGLKEQRADISYNLLTVKTEETIDQLSKELVNYYRSIC